MKQLVRLVSLILLLIIAFVSPLKPGTTGKIAGTITDKANGEPLFGVNVIVVGTSLGAATNLEGQFTILEVPPGTYEVQISSIGYEKTTIADVSVNIDQTTRVDYALGEESILVGEVIIVAERNLIKPDVATSVVSISGEELKDLPIANVQDVLGMQAGIGTDGRDFYIRGSGGNQSLFMVDGLTMRDPRNNQAITKVALSTVKEISIERGGFNAEYGQVQAGIVNIVTNEGEKQSYSGSIQVRIAPPAPKYYRGNGIPDVHDPDSYWMRPYLDPAVCWTGTTTPESEGGWNEYTRSKYLPFVGWNAIAQQLNTDNNPNNDLTPLSAQRVFLYETRKKQNNNLADYEIDGGFGGPVPFVSQALGNLRFFASYRRDREVLLFPQTRPDYMEEDGRLVLNADLNTSMRLKLTGSIGNIATMEENWNKGFYPRFPRDIAGGTGGSALFNLFSDWAYSLTDISHHTFSGKMTHNINPTSYYEVSLEYIRTHYFSRAPELRDNSKLYEIIPGFYETSNPFGYNPDATSDDGIIIWAGEQHSLARDNSVANATTLKADVTSQLDFNNLVKGGIELVYNDIDLDYGYIQMQTGGETYASRVQMRNFPLRAAAYLQDKLETKGFTLNAGLRLDFSNSQIEWWDFDSYDNNFISNKYNPQRLFTMKQTEGQWQLSPRLGISHPITENSKLFFNYGHFKQMPQYEALFRLDRRPDNTLVRIGDPNLTLARTISYELGFDYLFPENILLQVTAFYRDISDQQNTTQYQSIGGARYTLATSNNYSDIRGFELTIRKSAGSWFNGFINYTYQATSSGNFGAAQLYEDPALQKNYDENTENLYQTRSVPTPNAKANLTFHSPDDFGPKFMEQSILGGWAFNLLLNWSQGGFTTYNPKNVKGVTNNAQFIDYFDGTLRVSKTFLFNNFQVQLFADASNLFNNLRIWNTDDQEYRESLHLPKNKGYDNIPGDDKFGDYREPGVEWQPVEYMGRIDFTTVPGPASETGTSPAIYFDASTDKYWQYVNSQWSQVDQAKIDQINKDKAYINMPGASTFWFLNPRQIFFGLRVSFNLD